MKQAAKLVIALLVVTTAPDAHADPVVGPYIGLGAGADFPLDFASGTAAGTVSYRAGYLGNLAAGYSLGNGLRPELEIGYASARIGSTSGLGSVGGRTTKLTATVNLFYDFDWLRWPVTPYLGVGAGATRLRGSSLDSGTGVQTSGIRPSVQGIVGASYPLTPNLRVGLDYRYLETFNAHSVAAKLGRLTGVEAFPGVDFSSSHGNLGDNEVLLSLRYTFGEPPAPPAPPTPALVETAPPATPASSPELLRSFQVFFDFDKSLITADAATIIASAADEIKSGHLVSIAVIGHTDTVGSIVYNQKLSERRADAVKQELVGDGVLPSEISTKGVGKSDQLVPTMDQIREPQNRRAEILLK